MGWRMMTSSVAGWIPTTLVAWWALTHLTPLTAWSLIGIALLMPRHYLAGAAAASVWLWLSGPILPLLAALCCRAIGQWPARFWAVAPLRPLRLAPRTGCRHLARRQVKLGDAAMRTGRPGTALHQYLEALATHEPGTGCGPALLGRAAEAALRAGYPQLASELAAGGAVSATSQPLGRTAVRVARAHALHAWALSSTGDHVAAGQALRAAQRTTQPSISTDELVRTTAMLVHWHSRRLTADPEVDSVTLAEVLNTQQTRAGNNRVSYILCRAGGHRMARAGNFAEAVTWLHMATEHTGVHRHVMLTSPTVLTWWRLRLPRRWQGAVRLWLEALADEMRFRIEVGSEIDRGDRLILDAAHHLVDLFSDPLLAARLRIYRSRLFAAEAPPPEDLGTGHDLATCLSVFADPFVQDAWKRLRADTRAWTTGDVPLSDDTPWWEGWYAPEEARSAAAAAECLFTRLHVVAPREFGPALARVRGTLTTSGTAAPARPGPPATPAFRPATAVTGSTAPPTSAQPPASSLTATPQASERGSDKASAELELPAEPPQWLTEIDRLAGTRSWPVLVAVAEAYALRHAEITPGHLLLALLDDPVCAVLTEPCGIDAARLRAALRTLHDCAADQPLPRLDGPARSALRTGALLEQGILAVDTARAKYGSEPPAGDLTAMALLESLLSPSQPELQALLRTLGADAGEAYYRARWSRSPDNRAQTALPIRWTGARPDLRSLTHNARRALARAAEAAALGPGLLGPEHITDEAAHDRPQNRGADTPQPAGGLPQNAGRKQPELCRATPAAGRLINAAVRAARLQGHPGVDVSHFADPLPAGPPAGPSVLVLTAAAQAHAHQAKAPWIGPEHLAAALRTSVTSHVSGEPLPLTPLSARVLAMAARTAADAGLTAWDAADAARALAECWQPMSPVQPTWDEQSCDDALSGLARSHMWKGAVAIEAQRAWNAPTAKWEGAAHARWIWMLRFLTRLDPVAGEPRLAEELITAAYHLGPGAAAMRVLAEASARARRVAERAEDGQARLGELLSRIAACQLRLGEPGPAAAHYAEAAAVLRAPEPVWLADPACDHLLGWVLLHRAEILAAEKPAVAPAALLEAAAHQLAAVADGGSRSERVAAVWSALTAAELLARLPALDGPGSKPKETGFAVTTRALAVLPADPALVPVHWLRARLLWELDRGDLGLADLQAAVALDPKGSGGLRRYGALLLQLQHLDEAMEVLARAHEVDPENLEARGLLALGLGTLERHAEALALFDGVTSPDLLLGRARSLRAVGNLNGALIDTRAASAAEPEIAWYRYQYGLSLLGTGEERHGRQQIGMALRLERSALEQGGPWTGVAAGNIAVYYSVLGGLRSARDWHAHALRELRHPWQRTELERDLNELAIARPALAQFLATLS